MASNSFKNNLIIGVLGIAGSGKSTLSDVFQEKGFNIISLDEIGHEILDEEKDLVTSFFGNDILTGNKIDRKKLGNLVFSSESKLLLLNKIIHPKIKDRTISSISRDKNYIIEGALIDQIGLFEYLTHSVWIDIKEDIAINRLIKRGIKRQKALNIIKAQQFLYLDKEKCDYILDNNNGKDLFCEKIDLLYKKIVSSN
ncbi:MAG: dephospho-CoA kinase [Kosmotogales bacterium]|nr:dephospho-CoA kinase [Kosmotogales bacterium]